jgi:hypothetical protein
MPRAAQIAVAVALVLGVAVAAWTWMDSRSERRALVDAATVEGREEVAAQYEALEAALTLGHDAAAELQVTLQGHLTVSERSDEELATDRELQQDNLAEAGERLAAAASAPEPELADDADTRALRSDLDGLEDAKAQASDLAERFTTAAEAAGAWGGTLTSLRAQADRYVETVEDQPDTSDPQQLQALWEEELAVLRDYEEAAEEAAQVPGLEPLAGAYLDYTRANMTFAEQAIAQLENGEIEAYNEALRETYGTDDPFGFQEDVAGATQRSLNAGVVADLGDLRDDAAELVAFVTSRLQALREQLAPPQDPPPAPTPDPEDRTVEEAEPAA